MEASLGRQRRRRLATRQRISDAATRLMLERGFDAVTVDQIAEAADVSRMTVFNHFPRKEDMFFDLDEEGREALVAAVRNRPAGVSPLEALRRFPEQAIAEGRPYAQFAAPGSDHFVATVRASEALKARARAIRDELTDALAEALAAAVADVPSQPGTPLTGSYPEQNAERSEKPDAAGPTKAAWTHRSPTARPADPLAHLAAALVLATWTAALLEAQAHYARHGDTAAAHLLFLKLTDRGLQGASATLARTPYVEPGPAALSD